MPLKRTISQDSNSNPKGIAMGWYRSKPDFGLRETTSLYLGESESGTTLAERGNLNDRSESLIEAGNRTSVNMVRPSVEPSLRMLSSRERVVPVCWSIQTFREWEFGSRASNCRR